jgi:hypothetical protein
MALHEVTAYLANYHLCHLWVPPNYIHCSDRSFSGINSKVISEIANDGDSNIESIPR